MRGYRKAQALALAVLIALLTPGFLPGCRDGGGGSAADGLPTFKSASDFVGAFKNGVRMGGLASGMRLYDSVVPQASAGGESGKAPEHSSTNVQVEGVDEADLVKNDGEYIYTVSGDAVVILRAWPPEKTAVVSRIGYDGQSRPAELFLSGDRLAVIGSRYGDRGGGLGEHGGIMPCPDLTCLDVYDVSDRADPELLRSIEYEGAYNTARMIGEDVHVVLASHPCCYPCEEGGGELVPDDIIPRYRDTPGGRKPSRFVPACPYDEIAYTDPDAFTSFLSILSLSLKGGAEGLERQVIAGNSENVYASRGNLYVAGTEYPMYRYGEGPAPRRGRAERTVIYRFGLEGPRAVFEASAEVPGTVLNQFSMDEYDGSFRIATTMGHVSRSGSSTANNVYVLGPDLSMVGSLEGLAPGETIYSARFAGERAYLVTFKKTDPFFVLDLSDPSEPRVLGALKLPGYSDYLHPYDGNHVIGVGKNTVEADPREGDFAWYQGLKMALFDVSDVSRPREMYKVEIGDRGTDSYALRDHRAFLFDRERGLLVLPVLLAELTAEQKASDDARAFDCGAYVYQGAYVYGLSLEGGFELAGRVTHLEDPSELGRGCGYGNGGSVKRSLYIGDCLYTLSDAMVKVNRLDGLSEVAAAHLAERPLGGRTRGR